MPTLKPIGQSLAKKKTQIEVRNLITIPNAIKEIRLKFIYLFILIMLSLLKTIKLKLLCFPLSWPIQESKPNHKQIKTNPNNGSSAIQESHNSICVATFNAALFSMAPAVPNTEAASSSSSQVDFRDEYYYRNNKDSIGYNLCAKSLNDLPKGILKHSPLLSNSMRTSQSAKSKLRVSINLPDNEISLKKSGRLSFREDESKDYSVTRIMKGKTPLRSRTIVEVLRELKADILALQDVKAEEENRMKPLSDLADALGMKYAFAESWAPQYGNTILSKWPIKRWKAQKIFDENDFRNVLKATIEIPNMGEVDVYCTHLDHLNENWRMKQINAILESNDRPHILAGGLNSLDETDYSAERWTDIVKYYEEMGKPTPKSEVMRFLRSKQYADAKDYAGECESVVMVAKGQSVQGTCKYGTRVDYLLVSPDSPYKFVPGSYSVLSSKGTSDHHIVKVDLKINQKYINRKRRQSKQRIVKITNSFTSSKGIWKQNTHT